MQKNLQKVLYRFRFRAYKGAERKKAGRKFKKRAPLHRFPTRFQEKAKKFEKFCKKYYTVSVFMRIKGWNGKEPGEPAPNTK